MRKIKRMEVIRGVYWVEIPDAELYMLCGCPEDATKHLMRLRLIVPREKDGVTFETGPNAVLLSDVALQNGKFCNLAEFPVLQMLYRQGMLIPGHPNNTGLKPMLIGAKDQIDAQMEYIYRGNYGLTSVDEIIAAGETPERAEMIMRMKLKFAFGRFLPTEELLDHRVVDEESVEIRDGVTIRRIATNVFEISFEDETEIIDLTVKRGRNDRSAYPLGFQSVSRDYFSIIHSGQGDGWDINRPCMGSVLIFQGKIYLVDAGPNIAYSLTALGIGINEIGGIFHTHCHDDHFAGITSLLRTDRRIKSTRRRWCAPRSSKSWPPYSRWTNKKFISTSTSGTWNSMSGMTSAASRSAPSCLRIRLKPAPSFSVPSGKAVTSPTRISPTSRRAR